MNAPSEDPLHTWLDAKRRTAAPSGMAETIMQRLPGAPRPWRLRLRPVARAALLVLAISAGFGRYALIVLTILQS